MEFDSFTAQIQSILIRNGSKLDAKQIFSYGKKEASEKKYEVISHELH